MIPWIQVYSNLIRHPKVTKLADKLNLTSKDAGANVIAAGMLVSLWLWAAQNATDGDLSECSDRAIAEAAEYKKKPSLFVEALIYAKLLDEDRKLHDWDEYATLLIDCEDQQKEKTRKRVERHRAKKKALQNMECNVTVTPCNAPTIPNLTIPNNTFTRESKNILDNQRTAEETARSDGSLFTSFWNAYPENARTGREDAWEAWKALNPTAETAHVILEHLEAWKVSRRWMDDGGSFIPAPKNFLSPERGYMKNNPLPANQKECSWGSGGRPLDADDIEAIQRVMGKPIPDIDYPEETCEREGDNIVRN